MGNCMKSKIDKVSFTSSISYCPRLEIYENEDSPPLSSNIQKSPLLSRIQSFIIKEDPEIDSDYSGASPQINEKFHIQSSATSLYTRQQEGLEIDENSIFKLQNLHTGYYLHSHLIKHEHNKLNEVSACNNCNLEYDWWQFKYKDNNNVNIFHPLTNTYLKCLITNHSISEVSCSNNEPDEWILIKDDEILKQQSIIKLKHKESGLYLHTQYDQSKLEDQHIVSICKPDVANACWIITVTQ